MATKKLKAKAFDAWHEDRPLEAGRLLYERLPTAERPAWAARILQMCYARCEPIHEVDRLIKTTGYATKWHEARSRFAALRKLTLLAYDENASESYDGILLRLAENVAKVTYNASGGSAPYDHNAGWRIAADARDLVTLVGDPIFEKAVWTVLFERPPRAS